MTEHMSSAILRHRDGDPPGSDFRHARLLEEREVVIKRGNGSAVAKVLLIIGSSVISLLLALVAFFGARDRLSVDREFETIRTKQQQQDAIIAGNSAQILVFQAWATTETNSMREVKENQEKQLEQLRVLLIEARKR